MISKRTTVVCLPALLLSLFLCGCGYRMGSMMHPQIKTIAISEIRNDTREPLLTEVLRNQLAEAFQFDNSLSLKQKDEADCILYCRVKSVETRTIRENSTDNDRTYRPSEFQVTINAEFLVKIPGKSEPLIPLRDVSGSVNYQYNADPNVGKYYGLRQAAFNLSRRIVQYTTEAW